MGCTVAIIGACVAPSTGKAGWSASAELSVEALPLSLASARWVDTHGRRKPEDHAFEAWVNEFSCQGRIQVELDV